MLELFNQGQHLRHERRRTRLVIRLLHAQRGRILVHGLNETAGQLRDRLAVLDGALDDLVIDVGDIAHISNVQSRLAQPALHHIEHHHHPSVTKMAIVVDRHAADVHADLAWFDWRKRLLLTRQRVIYFQVAHGKLRLRAQK